MDSLINTIDYKGKEISIYADVDNESPLEWSNPEERGTWFVMYRREYDLPNELNVDFDDYSNYTDLAETVAKEHNLVYKFVRWYEHSGIAVSLRDDADVQGWDAGIVGVIFGNTTEDIENSFKNWQAYIQGDIYTFQTEYDCAGGYYGEDGYNAMMEEAKHSIDEGIKQDQKEAKEFRQVKKYCREHGYILAKAVK